MTNQIKNTFRERLSPKNCLIRLCRFCVSPMNNVEFDSDSEFRWYTFHCKICNHSTIIGEPLNDIFIESEIGINNHEPLTFEEQKLKNEQESKKHPYFTNHFQEENR